MTFQTTTAPSTSSSCVQSSAAMQRKQWWKKAIVKRTASFLETEMEAIISKSPFLQKPIPARKSKQIVLFDRSEIRTSSKPLGRGGFSVVHEIVGFDLCEAISRQLTPEQRQQREHYADTAIDPISGRGRFAIKHLQSELLLQQHSGSRTMEFAQAAGDMGVEAADLDTRS